MAQMQADPRDMAEGEAIPIGKLVNGAAAALSLALLVGVGVWGFRTVARDVSEVPVIKASVGVMRERPATPGGTPAAHQGLAVNAVAAEGSAARVPDQVRLAPRPVGLTDEDLPTAELPDPAEVRAAAAAAEAALAAEGDLSERNIHALAEFLAAGADKLEAPAAPAEELNEDGLTAAQAALFEDRPDAAEAAMEAGLPKPRFGLASSLRPRLRPAALRRMAPVEAALAGAAPGAVPTDELDPATLEPGTRLAQLGAYESAEVARQDWTRLAGNFGDYMEDKSRVIQKASSGGRTFYRLRAAGFDDLSDARRFCAAFIAQKAECIPVVTK